MGKLREAFDEFKENREERKLDKFKKQELKAKKNYREEADVDLTKLKNIDVKELNFNDEFYNAKQDEIYDLEQKNLTLEIELQDLLKIHDLYKTIIAARIDEILLLKRMPIPTYNNKGGRSGSMIIKNEKEFYENVTKGSNMEELARNIGINNLYNYYKDNFESISVDSKEDWAKKSEKIWGYHSGSTINSNLKLLGMEDASDMLKRISSINNKISDKTYEIEENNKTTQMLQGNFVTDIYDDEGDELQYAA